MGKIGRSSESGALGHLHRCCGTAHVAHARLLHIGGLSQQLCRHGGGIVLLRERLLHVDLSVQIRCFHRWH